jgi:hypothetical protein
MAASDSAIGCCAGRVGRQVTFDKCMLQVDGGKQSQFRGDILAT